MKLATCSCGAKFDVSAYAAGAKLKCAKCKAIFTVPEDGVPEEVAVPEEATAATAQVRPSGGGTQKTRTSTRSGASKTGPPTRTKTRTGGTKVTGSRSSGSYRPASNPRSGLYVALGGGLLAILILALVMVLKKGDDPKKTGTGGADDPGARTVQKIIDAVKPNTAKDWIQVAETCKTYGFNKEADEYVEKACGMAPDDPEIGNRFKGILQARMQALNTQSDSYADDVFKIAEQADKVGLKKFCEDLCVDLVGDGRKKGICPQHPGANKRLDRVLTPYGKYEDRELFEALGQVTTDRAAEEKMLAGLTPWERNFYKKKKDLEKSGLKCLCVQEPPYMIAVQESLAYAAEVEAKDFAVVAQHLYKLFRKEYADKFNITDIFEGPKAEEVLQIIVYDSKKTYMEKNPGIPEWAGGHFSPAEGNIQMYHGGGKPYETVFHEGTHQLVGAATRLKGGKDTNMFWFTEGIATFFEDFKRDENLDFVIGIKSRQYLPVIQQFLKVKKHVPFKDIIGKSYMQFRIEQSQLDAYKQELFVGLHYAESWSIVYFLYTYENGKYKEKFNQYFEKEISGQGTLENFKAIIGEPADLEKEWAAYIGNLKLD